MKEISDEAFKTAVCLVPEERVDEFAECFGISKPTARRWRKGLSSPSPIMRPHVIRVIKKMGFL